MFLGQKKSWKAVKLPTNTRIDFVEEGPSDWRLASERVNCIIVTRPF